MRESRCQKEEKRHCREAVFWLVRDKCGWAGWQIGGKEEEDESRIPILKLFLDGQEASKCSLSQSRVHTSCHYTLRVNLGSSILLSSVKVVQNTNTRKQ